MDKLSKQQRSWNMSRIRDRDTQPERAVRSVLHRMGYRFRLNQLALPGRPDIVMHRHRTVIFVHGCFWHRHKQCRFAYTPKSKKLFWQKKFRYNVAHDLKVKRKLSREGWNVITLWECKVSDVDHLSRRLASMLERIERKSRTTTERQNG